MVSGEDAAAAEVEGSALTDREVQPRVALRDPDRNEVWVFQLE